MNTSTKIPVSYTILQLVLVSTIESLADGTKTYTLKDKNVSVKTRKLIATLADLQRDTTKSTVYSGKGNSYDWSVTFGRGIDFLTIKVFVLNDYTVPLTAEAKREEVKQVAGITPVICIKREQRDYPDGTCYCTYISWGDYGRISVFVNTASKHATFYSDANVGIQNWERFSKAQQIALRIVKVWEKRWVA